MKAEQVIEVVCRELGALGQYYRNDWSGFDGRTLRDQLGGLSMWCSLAIAGDREDEFKEFSELLAEQ